MARNTPGIWRLHRDLIAVDKDTVRHIRRRVVHLQPTEEGVFELRRSNIGRSDVGHLVFDLLVRWTPSTKESHAEE